MEKIEFINEPVYYHREPILRIGTDCSGIEAPIQALEQLGIQYIHEWSSDTDKYCIKSIKANYNPKIIFGDVEGPFPDGDIRNRDNSKLPDIDLYACGFPCQPFSIAGQRKGLQDKRGNVFYSCLDVIKKKKPKYFILENVKGILWHDKINKKDKYGNTWNIIWSEIEKLKELGYYVYWKVLNTRDYGIPQNRERVYIVGSMDKKYEWPIKCEMENIRNYIDWNDTTKSVLTNNRNKIIQGLNPSKIIIDFGFRKNPFVNADKYCYTLCYYSKVYNTLLKRFLNIKEFLMLQGFDTNFKKVVSLSQLKKQIGNSMSVNVLCVIFKKNFHILQ